MTYSRKHRQPKADCNTNRGVINIHRRPDTKMTYGYLPATDKCPTITWFRFYNLKEQADLYVSNHLTFAKFLEDISKTYAEQEEFVWASEKSKELYNQHLAEIKRNWPKHLLQ